MGGEGGNVCVWAGHESAGRASNRHESFLFESAVVMQHRPVVLQYNDQERAPKGARRLCKDSKELTERREIFPCGRDVGEWWRAGRDRSVFPCPLTTSVPPFVPGNSGDLSKSGRRSNPRLTVDRSPASTVDPLQTVSGASRPNHIRGHQHHRPRRFSASFISNDQRTNNQLQVYSALEHPLLTDRPPTFMSPDQL